MELAADYTQDIENAIRRIITGNLDELALRELVVVACGAVGKRQATKGSDVDVIVIHDPLLDPNLVRYVRLLLCGVLLRQDLQPDYYGAGSIVDWRHKYVPENHFLLCSEVFFARPIVGASELFYEVLHLVSQRKTDLENAATYFTYTVPYRIRQRSSFSHYPQDIKYAPGGMRDLQFFNWVARRLCRGTSSEPAVFSSVLSANGFLTEEEAHRIRVAYNFFLWLSNELHGLKLSTLSEFAAQQICHLHHDKFRDSFHIWQSYQEHRAKILKLWHKVRRKAFWCLSADMGRNWGKLVQEALFADLDDQRRTRLVTEAMEDSLRIAGLWYSRDNSLLRRVYSEGASWAIKAVLAQNERCDPDILQEIGYLPGDENRDLRLFVVRNPGTSCETLVEMFRRADTYSTEKETIKKVLIERKLKECRK